MTAPIVAASVDTTPRTVARRAPPLDRDAAQPAGDAPLALGRQRRAPRKSPLSQPHDPAEAGLQRRDAGAELVAVQRQPGFEAQRVARAQARRA